VGLRVGQYSGQMSQIFGHGGTGAGVGGQKKTVGEADDGARVGNKSRAVGMVVDCGDRELFTDGSLDGK